MPEANYIVLVYREARHASIGIKILTDCRLLGAALVPGYCGQWVVSTIMMNSDSGAQH